MDNVSDLIKDLIDLLDRKRKLFDGIMEVTREQEKDIEQNEANGIEELIKQKQAFIDDVDKIDRIFTDKLNTVKKIMKIDLLEKADSEKYPDLKTLKAKVGEIMDMAEKIMAIEGSNRKKLEIMMDELRKGMKQLNVGKKSIKAYEGPAVYNDGIYFDKKK